MPVITNHAGLPLPLVEAVRRDPYSSNGSDITVTTLLKPARAVALERAHKDEITEDAADRLWSLIGQIGHLILERSGGMSTELRLFSQVRGWKVSGQMDLLMGSILTDYKLTSVWSCKDGLKPEWEQQMNALRWLASKNEVAIEKAQIVAIYRDWSKLEVKRSADYPRHQVQVFDVPLWTLEHAQEWIEDRVQVHQAAQSALEKNLPECTPDERWEKPEKFAVMKAGRERAVKLHATKEAAELHLKRVSDDHFWERREGEQVRCASYCAGRPFCTQADALGVPK